MTFSISTAHNEARLEGTKTFLDTGAGVGRIRVYDGTRPANGAAITTQVLLVEIPLDDPCGTVAAGVLTLAANTLPLIGNSGDATWGRVVNGNGDFAGDCDVSDTLGSGDIKLESTTLLAGGRAVLISGVLG